MKNLIPKRVMEYIIITFAVVLMDVGIYVFKFPNNFSFGGVSGMAVVFSHFIPMTSAQINLVINLILLVIGFIILGRDFGVKTVYTSIFICRKIFLCKSSRIRLHCNLCFLFYKKIFLNHLHNILYLIARKKRWGTSSYKNTSYLISIFII